jgi:hypothetical protein
MLAKFTFHLGRYVDRRCGIEKRKPHPLHHDLIVGLQNPRSTR